MIKVHFKALPVINTKHFPSAGIWKTKGSKSRKSWEEEKERGKKRNSNGQQQRKKHVQILAFVHAPTWSIVHFNADLWQISLFGQKKRHGSQTDLTIRSGLFCETIGFKGLIDHWQVGLGLWFGTNHCASFSSWKCFKVHIHQTLFLCPEWFLSEDHFDTKINGLHVV